MCTAHGIESERGYHPRDCVAAAAAAEVAGEVGAEAEAESEAEAEAEATPCTLHRVYHGVQPRGESKMT